MYGVVFFEAVSFYVRLLILPILWNPEVSFWNEAPIRLYSEPDRSTLRILCLEVPF